MQVKSLHITHFIALPSVVNLMQHSSQKSYTSVFNNMRDVKMSTVPASTEAE